MFGLYRCPHCGSARRHKLAPLSEDLHKCKDCFNVFDKQESAYWNGVARKVGNKTAIEMYKVTLEPEIVDDNPKILF